MRSSFYGIVKFWKTKRRTKIKALDQFLETDSTIGRWLPVFLWAALIFFLSSIAQVKASEFLVLDFIFKKTAHLTEYAILYLLIFRATKKNLIFSLILTLAYALSDEIHQSFVPGRTAAWYDFGLDLSGASIAAYILWKIQSRLTRQQIQKKRPKK